MVYQYNWKVKGLFPVEANVVGQHMEKLQKEQGAVTSKNLLESARPVESAIHDCYEWNDGIAAEKYRLEQSQCIIANIARVVMVDDGKTEKTVRAFVNIAPSDKFTSGEFIDIDTALSSEKARKIVLEKALKELQTFRDRYEDFNELTNVFKAISDLEKDIA